jgi:hypothetical protein
MWICILLKKTIQVGQTVLMAVAKKKEAFKYAQCEGKKNNMHKRLPTWAPGWGSVALMSQSRGGDVGGRRAH